MFSGDLASNIHNSNMKFIIIFLLQPYHPNISKRLVKSAKLYFYDVGLAAFLLGIENEKQVSRDPLRGELYDHVITVCADTEDTCPIFPGIVKRRHMPFPDPSGVKGTQENKIIPTRCFEYRADSEYHSYYVNMMRQMFILYTSQKNNGTNICVCRMYSR